MKDGSRGGEGGAPYCRVGQDSLSGSVLPHNAHLDSFIWQTSEQHQSFCNFTAFPISFGSKSLYFRNYNLLTCFHVPASSIWKAIIGMESCVICGKVLESEAKKQSDNCRGIECSLNQNRNQLLNWNVICRLKHFVWALDLYNWKWHSCPLLKSLSKSLAI